MVDAVGTGFGSVFCELSHNSLYEDLFDIFLMQETLEVQSNNPLCDIFKVSYFHE